MKKPDLPIVFALPALMTALGLISLFSGSFASNTPVFVSRRQDLRLFLNDSLRGALLLRSLVLSFALTLAGSAGLFFLLRFLQRGSMSFRGATGLYAGFYAAILLLGALAYPLTGLFFGEPAVFYGTGGIAAALLTCLNGFSVCMLDALTDWSLSRGKRAPRGPELPAGSR